MEHERFAPGRCHCKLIDDVMGILMHDDVAISVEVLHLNTIGHTEMDRGPLRWSGCWQVHGIVIDVGVGIDIDNVVRVQIEIAIKKILDRSKL